MKCKTCGREMSAQAFPVRGLKVDGSPSYRSSCRSCWNAIRRERESPHRVVEIELIDEEPDMDSLVKSLVDLAGQSTEMLSVITKEEFINYTDCQEPFSFSTVKEKAFEYLDSIGVGNPATETISYTRKVLVIGDTYGQHTRTGMFKLIKNICNVYHVDTIVAVGRQLDENNTLSHCFKELDVPVIFVATADEISHLHKMKEPDWTIVRESVEVGNITVRNQEQITPYVKKAIYSIDQMLFPNNTIVNCTRQEYGVRSCGDLTSFIASPGTLAEPFVPKIRNKLMIKNGLKVAEVFSSSFKKYRKAEEDKNLWQQGCILINNAVPLFLPIKRVEDKYVTAFDGQIITEDSVEHTHVSVVMSDLHTPNHNKLAFNAFLDYCNNRNIDTLIMNGDIVDMEAVNPHILSRGELPRTTVTENIVALDSAFQSIANVVSEDTKLVYITGNHSDFLNRWTNKNPQFESLFESILLSISFKHNVDWVTVNGNVMCGNETAVLHGNAYISSSGSTNTERTARSFRQSIIGHSHSTNLRFGCLRLGCLCDYNQGYNSPYGNWDRSFGVITSYNGVDFVSPIFIILDQIVTGNEILHTNCDKEVELSRSEVEIEV